MAPVIEELCSKIVIHCEECSAYLRPNCIKDHQYLHKSLSALQCDIFSLPSSSIGLSNLRTQHIQRTRTPQPTKLMSLLKKIDDAYSFLNLLMSEEAYNQYDIPDVKKNDLETSKYNFSSCGVKEAASCNFKLNKNEQKHSVRYWQNNGENMLFIGMFDGYNGQYSADLCYHILHKLIRLNISEFSGRHIKDFYEDFNSDILNCNKIHNNVTKDMYEYINRIQMHCRQKLKEIYVPPTKPFQLHENLLDSCESTYKYDIQIDKSHIATSAKSDNSYENKSENHKSRTTHINSYCTFFNQAFNNAYKTTDILLKFGCDEVSKVRWSGTSLATIIIEEAKASYECSMSHNAEPLNLVDLSDDKTESIGNLMTQNNDKVLIHLANAGNVQAVLVGNRKTCILTKDHSCKNKVEKHRVLSQGGKIFLCGDKLLLNGVSEVTRGLGNHGDKLLKKCVATKPYTNTFLLNCSNQVLIIATPGLWKILSTDDVASIVDQVINNTFEPDGEIIYSNIRDLIADKTRSTNEVTDDLDEQETNPHEVNQHASSVYGETTSTNITDLVRDQVSKEFSWATEPPEIGVHCDDKSECDTSLSLSEKIASCLVRVALLAGSTDDISVVAVVFG